MALKQVTVSGAVGKQVFASDGSKPVKLKGVILTPSAANAYVKIRDGKQGASGDVLLWLRATSANGSVAVEACHYFTRGLHVEVIGTNAQAYLVYE